MVTRAQVVECARSYLSTPWHHQARVKGLKGGIDCAGLIICVGEELGLFRTSEIPNYSRYPDGTLAPTCARYLTQISSVKAQPGDVLLFAFDIEPHHLGFMAEFSGRPTVIHSYAQARKVVENGLDPTWRPLIRGAYSIPGIE